MSYPTPHWQGAGGFPAALSSPSGRSRFPMACLLATLGCGGLALLLVLGGLLGTLALGGGTAETAGPPLGPATYGPASPEATTAPVGRSHPDDVAYANESYQVPAARPGPVSATLPTTDTAVSSVLQRSPLYAGSVATPVRCPNDPIMASADPTGPQLHAGIERQVACLMRLWQPVAAQAGIELRRPDVVVFTGTSQSPCGTLANLNYYCSENATLYFKSDPPRLLNADGQVTFRMENLVAHEFGHHVQATFAILHAEWYFARNATPEAALEWSRRLELQADCLSAVAWTATAYSLGGTAADVASMSEVAQQLGDDPDRPGDHGKGQNAVLWISRGLEGKNPRACNTFAAPASEVA